MNFLSPAYLWLLPEQYVPETHVLKDNKRGDLGTFVLHEGLRIRGKVLDAQGKPMAGVLVNAVGRDRNEEITLPVADQINRSAVTDAKGRSAVTWTPGATAGEQTLHGSIRSTDVTGTYVVEVAGREPAKGAKAPKTTSAKKRSR